MLVSFWCHFRGCPVSQPSLDHTLLNGPMFVDWLYRQCPDLDGAATVILGASATRRIRDWRLGTCPDAYDIPDRLCVALGLHLDEIPDEIWITSRPMKRTRKRQPWEKRKALEMLREGWLPTEVAREMGVTARAVQYWREHADEFEVAA